MVRISPDVGRNRIIIEWSGAPTSVEAATAERELREALSRLRPPIDVLSDIRELETMETFLPDDFHRLSTTLSTFGLRKIVRVVGKSALAAVHMERLSRRVPGHTAHLAFSLAEAEQVFGK